MGCDIHGWIEKKIDGKYVAINELNSDERNYSRFAQLASVRGESENKPKGIPDDISDTVKYHIDDWSTDGHSHSYMNIDKAAEIFLNSSNPSDYTRSWPYSSYFDIEDDNVEDFRLVFWFDN